MGKPTTTLYNKPSQANINPKREKAETLFAENAVDVAALIIQSKSARWLPTLECRNCKKTGHLAKICASHIFGV